MAALQKVIQRSVPKVTGRKLQCAKTPTKPAHTPKTAGTPETARTPRGLLSTPVSAHLPAPSCVAGPSRTTSPALPAAANPVKKADNLLRAAGINLLTVPAVRKQLSMGNVLCKVVAQEAGKELRQSVMRAAANI